MLRKENAMAGRACEWESGSEDSRGLKAALPVRVPDHVGIQIGGLRGDLF